MNDAHQLREPFNHLSELDERQGQLLLEAAAGVFASLEGSTDLTHLLELPPSALLEELRDELRMEGVADPEHISEVLVTDPMAAQVAGKELLRQIGEQEQLSQAVVQSYVDLEQLLMPVELLSAIGTAALILAIRLKRIKVVKTSKGFSVEIEAQALSASILNFLLTRFAGGADVG